MSVKVELFNMHNFIIIVIIIAIFFRFMTANLTISLQVAGLYTSAMSLLSFFSSPILGNLCDKYGRRTLFFQIGSLFNIVGE